MSKWTVAYGASLAALGVAGFVATGAKHKTALIPAAFGAAEIGLGLLARRRGLRTLALGGAALLGVAAFAATARSLGQLPAIARGEAVERKPAVLSKSAMAALSAAYLVGLALDR